jgi:hypothetical protein
VRDSNPTSRELYKELPEDGRAERLYLLLLVYLMTLPVAQRVICRRMTG